VQLGGADESRHYARRISDVLLKRKLSVVWAAAIMLLTVLLASGAALAITNGTPDGTRHSYVGALVDEFDGETYPYCTGTLISPTVLLTAAHCYPETKDHFYVTFVEKPTSDKSEDQGITGTWHEHPTLDIGVVKFAGEVAHRRPGRQAGKEH
jgi:hypothetical protein